MITTICVFCNTIERINWKRDSNLTFVNGWDHIYLVGRKGSNIKVKHAKTKPACNRIFLQMGKIPGPDEKNTYN